MIWWNRNEKRRQDLRERIMAKRQDILRKLEGERKSKIILLIHRCEPWADA